MKMARLRKKQKETAEKIAVPATQGKISHPFALLGSYFPLSGGESRIYYSLRQAIPIIDAAILKTVRLTGGFTLECESRQGQEILDFLTEKVPVGGNQMGLYCFLENYLEQLLTLGTAVGEIVTDVKGMPKALFNSPLENVELKRNENGFDIDIYVTQQGMPEKLKRPELCLLSVLNPTPGELHGNSLLKGLPFVSSILLKIYECIGSNWERAGNLRYSVTYSPKNDALDKAYAKDRAQQIAKEWSNAMKGDEIRDFVAVGDVQIKVIGADSPILDSNVPVRQLLEQIVAKTALPPFMLGLSWSSTERMSSAQADALTSELESYRRVLTPVIIKICTTFLRARGCFDRVRVLWDDITLQDEVELARCALYRAQAEQIERSNNDK